MIDRLKHVSHHTDQSRGQILILVAFLFVALIGALGLAIDLGYAFAQRRTVQNAADAGAIAGARAITKWSTTNNTVTALPDVQDIVDRNKMGSTNQTIETCEYVNDSDTAVGTCGSVVPATATGVRVTVRETHSTFFIHAVPGAPNTVSTKALAIAHVQAIQPGNSDGPFIVCGSDTKLFGGGNGNRMDILTSTGEINDAAIGQTFEVHSPQVSRCGLGDSSFKGIAAQGGNVGKKLNQWWDGDTGTQAGPMREEVNGIQGCKIGTPEPYNCVMFLPIATNNPPGYKDGSTPKFTIKAMGAFYVTSCGSNCHKGTLLGGYSVSPPAGLPDWTGSNGWVRGGDGTVTVRLTT